LPARQVCPAGQAIPQAPQFAASRVMSVQRPLQIWVWQIRHTPVTQVSPAAQLLPQAPQFNGSSAKFTHSPPQLEVGRAQPAHMPFSQV
jgi:hypothetical protein